MKKLKIEVYDYDYNKIETITAEKIDATNVMTIISTSKSNKESDVIRWPQNIDHWDIIPGMVTIYYNNGYCIEITRQ